MKLFEVFWIAFQNLDFETIQISDPAVELEEHRRILEAVKDGDVALTRQRLVQHFSHLQDRLRRAIEARETDS
jgi:DNA-binding GntR family transcriptional regulator